MGNRWPTGIERITTRIDVDGQTHCWNYTGTKTRDGYGVLTGIYAHRLSYELHVAPIPEGMQLDHLCNNTSCVNPEHLEPVTPDENMRRVAARRTHCKRGHEFTEANTYHRLVSGRQCRRCNQEAVRRYVARRAGRAA